MQASARLSDYAASVGRAGERDKRNSGMVDDCSADLFAQAVHQLNDLGWKTCLQQNLHQQCTCVWHVLGRLEDHSISANERWKHLPGRDRHWKIERTNEA